MPFGKHDVSQKGKKGGKEDQWHPTDEKAKRALTEYEASIKIGKFFRVKERLRVIARKKKTTARMVRKIFFYLFFVMVTLRANLELSNPQEYNLVQRLRSNFYHDSEIGEQAMEEVVTIANFWEWIETRFIPQYYSTVTFDGEDQPRLKNDIFAYNRKVGGVRFGQVRLKKNHVPLIMPIWNWVIRLFFAMVIKPKATIFLHLKKINHRSDILMG